MNGSKASSGRAAWRLVGCLIKAPLGCLAFFIGAAVVLVLFLPPALGGLVSDGLEEWFARRYRGTLEVKEAWLGSLYGPQKVESITLRDPERNEILHATLRAPSLGPVFWEGAEDWGPIEIHVDNVRLVRDADGVSNLALALTRRPLTEGDEDSAHELDIPRELQMGLRTVAFVVEIDRFSWADTAGHEVRLTDVVCDGLLNLRAPSMQMDVEGVATLTDGVVDAVAFELTLPELLRWSEPAATPPWSFELSAGPVPVAAAEILVGVFDRLDRALGPTVERIELALSGEGHTGCRLDRLELRSEAGAITLAGRWRAGEDILVAEPGDLFRATFPDDSWWSREVVPQILPLMENVEVDGTEGWAALELEDFTIPLGGDLRDVSGRCRLELEALTYTLADPLRAELRSGPERQRVRGPLGVILGEGYAQYDGFTVSTGRGAVEVRGSYDLRERQYQLIILLPEKFGGASFEVEGTRAEPTFRPVRD